MLNIDRLLSKGDPQGLEQSFKVGERSYHVFAFTSPGRSGPRIRWNLYEGTVVDPCPRRGLSFGIAQDMREALEDVVRAAERHARCGSAAPLSGEGFTFRPPPSL